ncbi:putative mediator of rna polymerase ii transcription subunit 16 [Diaporthe ampelina]|uniref:Mediator of RNA polymerase II transcription subunit 16 n=1 Tax=Diaporthe ampelina TaxID=1214573 RepID=A0A0G2I8H5_9PEZI|nr:putative mediator of rna polymerase ii transcription subunit 16 [Diaporthe ampelina]
MTSSKMPMMLDDHMGPLGAAMPNMDDDLFGDEVLPMATRPPSKQLQQRVDEMRSRGCCRSISCSKLGTIASISPDGTHINLQCSRANPSDVSWELSEPTPCSIFSPTLPGGPIVHLAWAPAMHPELAVIDAYGRTGKLFIPPEITPLRVPNQVQFNVTYGPAVRENGKYQYNNNIIQASGPWHPNPSKSALVCVTANGLLKLFYPQNSNLVQETQLEMESITSSDDLITHAAMCSDRGKLVVILATAARQLKVLHAEINWGTSQPQDKQIPPGSLPLKPSLKAEHITGTSWLQQGLVESHLDASMDQISCLEVYAPVLDMKTKSSLPATILVVRSHVPPAQTPYNVEYQSIIDRWDILTDQPQHLHPAFEQRGSKTGSASALHPMTRLRKRESIVINKIIISIETTQLGRVICIGFSDGTIQLRDRSTMAEMANEDHHNLIMVPQQAGFQFDDEKPCVQMAISPNNCSFTQVCENGKLRWNSLKYPVDQIGSTRQDPQYDAVLAGLTLAAANAAHQASNYDDVLAVARPFVEKHPRFLHDLVSTLVFMLNINVDYSEDLHHDALIRNLQIQTVFGLLNHLGFRGEFKPRSFISKFAMLGLNIRHIVILITLASNSSMNPAKEKWTPLDEPEVVDALTGCAKWALDLLCWLTDSLFVLRDDPKFMELLNPGRFSEMTAYLKSKNDISLHFLLCSSTRGFLLAACKRLSHLQAVSAQATQYWDKNAATHNSTDSHANQGIIAVQQAYLKMQRCITTALIKVKEIERLLNILGAEIKQAYQASLAILAQKQQQQSGKPNQPPPDTAIKKAQAHCELNMLLAENPPPQFLAVIKKLFEVDLKNLMASTDRSGLFFTDFELLEVEEDPRRLAARKAQGKYVDTFKRVELTAYNPPKASEGDKAY